MRLERIAEQVSGAKIGTARAGAAGRCRQTQILLQRALLLHDSGDIIGYDNERLGGLDDYVRRGVFDDTHRGAAVDYDVLAVDLDAESFKEVSDRSAYRHTNNSRLCNVAADGEPFHSYRLKEFYCPAEIVHSLDVVNKNALGNRKIPRSYHSARRLIDKADFVAYGIYVRHDLNADMRAERFSVRERQPFRRMLLHAEESSLNPETPYHRLNTRQYQRHFTLHQNIVGVQ